MAFIADPLTVANHVNLNVQNPTAYSTWSREASLNTVPAIDVTTRRATSGYSDFFSGHQLIDSDNAISDN